VTSPSRAASASTAWSWSAGEPTWAIPSLTQATGDATVYGSLWTQDINLIVGGSAIIKYSSQALALAGQVAPKQPAPVPLQVLSLADCGLAHGGNTGCP